MDTATEARDLFAQAHMYRTQSEQYAELAHVAWSKGDIDRANRYDQTAYDLWTEYETYRSTAKQLNS